MRTEVRVVRGRFRGRQGWISGRLEDRAARGITKALVHVDGVAEFLALTSIEPLVQLELPGFGNGGHWLPPAASQSIEKQATFPNCAMIGQGD